MIIPAAMFIESAVDSLKKVNPEKLEDQAKELYSGTGRKEQDFIDGYNLGLQTARIIISGSVEIMLHQANPNNIL